MPHPLALAAAIFGGVAALGYAIYHQLQEQENYEQYQRTYRQYQEQQRNVFRHSDDFDFDNDNDDDYNRSEKFPRDDKDASTLRSRKPFEHRDSSDNEHEMLQSINTVSSAQDQYELTQLEDSIAERRRRLLAEQAFLDKEEESIKHRRMELIRSEQELYSSAATSSEPVDTHEINERMMVFNPFADRFGENSSSSDDESDTSDNRHASSSGENTAILINSLQHQQNQEDSFNDASSSRRSSTSTGSSHSRNSSGSSSHSSTHHLSTSNLQFPDASQVLVTDSEASSRVSSSRAVSDSEESWDAVSENDWTRQSDSEH